MSEKEFGLHIAEQENFYVQFDCSDRTIKVRLKDQGDLKWLAKMFSDMLDQYDIGHEYIETIYDE